MPAMHSLTLQKIKMRDQINCLEKFFNRAFTRGKYKIAWNKKMEKTTLDFCMQVAILEEYFFQVLFLKIVLINNSPGVHYRIHWIESDQKQCIHTKRIFKIHDTDSLYINFCEEWKTSFYANWNAFRSHS